MRTVNYNNICVFYQLFLDGGGKKYIKAFDAVIKENFGHVTSICEMACGPGFLGFYLLSEKLCDQLTLVDINPVAIQFCNKTITHNSLNMASAIVSDSFAVVNSKFDLIIINPPHYAIQTPRFPNANDIRIYDKDWIFHRKFYSEVIKHLTPGGSVLAYENSKGSKPNDFMNMIASGGLSYVKTIIDNNFYFMWSKSDDI